MSIYRIYSSYKGLHIIDKVDSVEKVINCIEKALNKGEIAHYLVVENNIEQNTDIPYLSIWDEQEFYDFKEEYFKKQQTFVKTKGIR